MPMGAADLSVSDADLDLLDAYLLSDQSPPESMLLSDLDGFLTGIAIGQDARRSSYPLASVLVYFHIVRSACIRRCRIAPRTFDFATSRKDTLLPRLLSPP